MELVILGNKISYKASDIELAAEEALRTRGFILGSPVQTYEADFSEIGCDLIRRTTGKMKINGMVFEAKYARTFDTNIFDEMDEVDYENAVTAAVKEGLLEDPEKTIESLDILKDAGDGSVIYLIFGGNPRGITSYILPFPDNEADFAEKMIKRYLDNPNRLISTLLPHMIPINRQPH